jgi:hypothetical protein
MPFAILAPTFFNFTDMRRYLFVFAWLLLPQIVFGATSPQQLQQLITQQQYRQAAEVGDAMLKKNPQDVNARFLTAYAYQMNSNPDKAEALYQQLMREHPELPEPRNNLAMIYLARGDYDRATTLLAEAINTHPSYATAYANLSRLYKGIASEAYRRAVSESSEPAKYTHDIELTAIAELDAVTAAANTLVATPNRVPAADNAAIVVAKSNTPKTRVNVANLDTLMIETVRNWAKAWSDKDFARYTDAYRPDYRSHFNTRAQWLENRRQRILKPADISVKVSDFAIKQRSGERISVDFTQAFSSPGYSDRVVKRLDFDRVGSTWKIVSERVLSVL